MTDAKVFISYSGHDAFEASLLQYAIESLLATEKVSAWTYQRDQALSESAVATALKAHVRDSLAMIFIVSPTTIECGAAQWMELAYADAFGIKTYVLLHHLDYQDLKSRSGGVPPLLLASQCNAALRWKEIVENLRELATGAKRP